MSVVSLPIALEALYSTLSTTSVTIGPLNKSAASFILDFMLAPDDENLYNMLVTAIQEWIDSDNVEHSVGLNEKVRGLRIAIIAANGHVYYDSNAKLNNLFENINIPSRTTPWNGKYIINENHNTRVYTMGALLSSSGKFAVSEYSTSTSSYRQYLAVRQGFTTNQPIGTIVISLDTQS
jgi:hypothetical protein